MPLVSTLANAGVSGLRSSQAPVQWVTVHDSGGMFVSREAQPKRFDQITSSFGSTAINCVATDGAGTWVAVGGSGKIASSTDGINWTQRTSQFSTTAISFVAYGGGTWVAVGGSGKVSTSTDGSTWTAVTTATSGWSTSYNIGHVAYGNGYWVGINSNGTLRSTTNPSGAWTSRTVPLGTGQHYADYHPAIGSGIWTLGTETGTSSGSLGSSTDAQTWTARSAATSSTADTQFGATSNSTTIMAASKDASSYVLQKSTNGTSWTAVTEPNTANYPAIALRGNGSDLVFVYWGADPILGWNFASFYSTTDVSTFTAWESGFYDTAGVVIVSTLTNFNYAAHRNGHQALR
jgi:hypothetical protein